MKRGSTIILALVLIFSVSITGDVASDADEIGYTTGAIPMTEEDVSALMTNIPEIIEVKSNALFFERLQAEYSESFSVENITQPVAEYGEEIVRSIVSDTVVLMEDENILLPSKVDNSIANSVGTSTFPVISNQEDLGACVGWSFGYYQLTNNTNRVRGTSARNIDGNIAENVCSPNWVYNLGNGAKNSGMSVLQALNILYTYGCPTTDLIPVCTTSVVGQNFRTWYTVENIWENALYNKCDLYRGSVNSDKVVSPVSNASSDELKNLKKILANGYVVSFETKVYNTSSKIATIAKKGYDADNNELYAWTEFRSDGSNHALTIVGYNDDFYVDINGNNIKEVGEYGAFKVANSWGDVKYHTDGCFWMPYDALNQVSVVKETNHSKRIPALSNYMYYLLVPLKEYKPLLLGDIEIETNNRNGLTAVIGIYNMDDPDDFYEQSITKAMYIDYDEDTMNLNEDIAFNGIGGNYNLNGVSGDETIGEVVFDFTLLLHEFKIEENHNYGLYVRIENPLENEIEIKSFKIKDLHTGEIFESTKNMIVNNIDQSYAELLYLSSIMSVESTERITIEFNSNVSKVRINSTNIFIIDSTGNCMDIILSLSRNNSRKVYIDVNEDNGEIYNNGFYRITIMPELMSQGGNKLNKKFEKEFYTSFH